MLIWIDWLVPLNCRIYLFLLIHFEQFGNRSGLKSASALIRFWTLFNNACSYEPYGSCICWFDAIASSSDVAVLAMDVEDDAVAVLAPFITRDCSTWRTACGNMLFGSTAVGFELLINLRRFDDMPDIYASLNGRCGLCYTKKPE